MTRVAYLTFDDGPAANTMRILAIQKQQQVKATFFVLGTNRKTIYRQILKDSHTIGNHSYSHQYSMIYASVNRYLRDFERLERLLRQTTGRRTTLFRFPGGSNIRLPKKSGGIKTVRHIAAVLHNRGYKGVDWTINSLDSRTPAPSKKWKITHSPVHLFIAARRDER
ncbi:polysaccharide deacetylase family protein [Paenibacillus sp. YAF4_2]|uniref:polysaccharide deacetylase family protein n=1 Tax=Paenibacillus sp. YAF4_2 TaxID=3233085 RepID=UPI003F96CC9F